MKKYHLLPRESGWKLTLSGFDYPIESYTDRSRLDVLGLAVSVVKASGDPATLRVYHPDGSVAEERSFTRKEERMIA